MEHYGALAVEEASREEPKRLVVIPPRMASNLDYPVSNTETPFIISRSSGTKPKGYTADQNNRSWMISFHADQVPQGPNEEAIEFAGSLAKDANLLDRVKAVLDMRPIVSRQFISEMTGMSSGALAHILPMLAYFFTDGPWLKSWVRYGVDPRTEPESRWLQTISLRQPIPIPASDTMDSRPSYVFTGEAGSAYGSVYQICDIEYGPAKTLVAEAQVQPLCHKADGWFPRKTLDSLRTIIKRRWVEILRETNPEGYELYLETVKKASVSARPKSKFVHLAKAGAVEMRKATRTPKKVLVDPSVIEGSFKRISRLRGDADEEDMDLDDDDNEYEYEEDQEEEEYPDVENEEDDEDEEYEFYDE